MKLKDIVAIGKKTEPKLFRKFEDFVIDNNDNHKSESEIKTEKNKKSRKNKKHSDLPFKKKKKITQNSKRPANDLGNYYTKYGSNFNYYK